MAHESLLQILDEAIIKVRSLERENSETSANIKALEREARELRSLIAQAESKVDELLYVRSSGISRPQAVQEATASKGLQQLMEPSAYQPVERKRRFPSTFDPDSPSHVVEAP